MSTYVIGDVHGCFDELKKLLKKISFNPSKDSIIFTGDLVNRGNQSLEVLEFCMKERSIDDLNLICLNFTLDLNRFKLKQNMSPISYMMLVWD